MTETVDEVAARLWRPRQRVGPLEWSRENVTLSERYTRRPGAYDPEWTPYMMMPHEWFGDRGIRQITGVKAAQLGGTTWIANLIMWAAVEDPGPMLYVTASLDVAKSWSERELSPRFRECQAMRSILPTDPDDFRKLEMHLKTCTIRLQGSNSPGNLASRPVRYLFCDEIDKWPDQSDAEAPALELAMVRTAAFADCSKVVMISTPTLETGAIWQQFLAGTQHRFRVPCPACGHRQELVFAPDKQGERGGVRWPRSHRDMLSKWDLRGVERDAAYECSACGDHWSQEHARAIIAQGEWGPTNLQATGEHVSFHISSLYSPNITWGKLARMFLEKSDQIGGLHDFRNNWLGLPWEPQAAAVKDESVLQLVNPTHQLKLVPIVPAALTMCADVGQDRTHWSVQAWSETGETWMVDYGTTLLVEDLLGISEKKYTGPDGVELTITGGLVDSGDQTMRVYDVCAASEGRLWPAKGTDAAFGAWGRSLLKTHPGMILYTFVDHTAKIELYLNRIGKRMPPPWHLPRDVGQDFIAGHTGQTLLRVRTPRGWGTKWKNLRGDHYGDCSKLQLLCWWILKDDIAAEAAVVAVEEPAPSIS